jgi:hypothetical protein
MTVCDPAEGFVGESTIAAAVVDFVTINELLLREEVVQGTVSDGVHTLEGASSGERPA